MNRIDRVSAILIQLQSRRVVKAADIAKRFDISLRTVYRDIRTLEEAGVPVIGEAGVGYSIVDGYRLPPVMFTREEATAFLTAEKFVSQLTDVTTAANHQSAMFKIRSILKSNEKSLLEEMDDNIKVFRNAMRPEFDNKDHLQPLLNAIAAKQVMQIDYVTGQQQEHTRRKIEPIGIFFKDSCWHLIAYCRLRKDYRDFRVDRINDIANTAEVYTGKHPTLNNYLKKTIQEQALELVIINVSKKMHGFLEHQKYYNGFISERAGDGFMQMNFLTASFEGFARWFMMFADSAEIIKPAGLKTRVAALAEIVHQKNLKAISSC